ncbi:hypothetical protein ACQU0X_26905 [Pseudovibrio ascidiaceicola]|uniref:hypothetical protein n=1 Tax=Pseudovibrio ascidiaceicola TaxID=285279 RepID=UPI003D36C852
MGKDYSETVSKLMRWAITLRINGLATFNAATIVLSPRASTGFGIGYEQQQLLFGALGEAGESITSVTWYSAAMILNFHNTDWIVLYSQNIRKIKDIDQDDTPIPMRLWIPTATGRLNVYKDQGVSPPDTLTLLPMVNDGQPTFDLTSPVARLSLKHQVYG